MLDTFLWRGSKGGQVWQGETDSFYYTVVDAMLKTSFSEDEIGKIGGGNFCRLFAEATEKQN